MDKPSNHHFEFSFQILPPEYKNAFDQISGDLIKIYSEFNINFLKCPETIDESLKKTLKSFLYSKIKDFKLITYDISKESAKICNSTSQNINIVICAEKECFIIRSINRDLSIELLKSTKASLIDCQKNTLSTQEVRSFCSNYYYQIKSNIFIKNTINPMVAYLIRRYFYPSEFFKDKRFFTFCDHRKLFDEKVESKVNDIIINKGEFNITFSNQITKEIEDEKEEEEDKRENKINYFNKNEFITLRQIKECKFTTIYLVIHIKTLYIFILKEVNNLYDRESKKFIQHEIDFCSKYSNRCLTPFYGFVMKEQSIIGEIYEFMSNGNLHDYKGTNEFFNQMTINRLFQGINYLHSNSLIHRDLNPFNILLNHDNVPYISDFDTTRSIDQTKSEMFTSDIGSNLYASPEQNGSEDHPTVSFSTDIYSFGQIIYFLYEKKDMFNGDLDAIYEKIKNKKIPKMKNASEDMQTFIEKCISWDPEERPKIDEIKFFICEQNAKLFKEKISVESIKEKETVQFLCEDVTFKYKYLNEIFALAKNYYIVQKDYILAYKYFEVLADLKFPEAIFYMGNFYQFGNGVNKDLIKAVEYYNIGAELDDYKCNFVLGQFYVYGVQVQQNIDKAIEYLKKAARKKQEANFILGGIYIELKNDFEEGKKYLEEASRNNYLDATYALGAYYYKNGDMKKALEYFESGLKQNHGDSIFNLGLVYFDGKLDGQNYTKAREYFSLGEKINDSQSCLYLGIIYENGHGTPKDFNRAKYLYKKAIELGLDKGYCYLGSLYYNGNENNPPDFVEAKKCFDLAAGKQDPKGFFYLGLFYYDGKSEQKDYSKAKEYFELSAEKENPDALYYLGLIYFLGKGLIPDYPKAFNYFNLAAEKNNFQSLYYIGMFYENGFGVNVDIAKAIEFYEKSAAIHYNRSKIVNKFSLIEIENDEINPFHFVSFNNLGMIYITEKDFEDQDIAEKYLLEAGLNEYSYGENNLGLFYQYFLNSAMNQENENQANEKVNYYYKKASETYGFALSEYNRGYISENIDKAIFHYKKALQLIDNPLIFKGQIINDFKLNVSKCFVACYLNLRLASFSLSKNISQSNIEAKEYFLNAIFRPLFTLLLNDQIESYSFEFKILNEQQNLTFNLKDFIFNFPLFKYSNQINKFSSEWRKYELNLKELKFINIQYQRQNNQPIRIEQENNKEISLDLIKESQEIMKDVNQKIMKDVNQKIVKDVNQELNETFIKIDYPDDDDDDDGNEQENDIDSCRIPDELIESIFYKMNSQKLFELKRNHDCVDSRLEEENDFHSIFIKSLENKIKRYVKYPRFLNEIFFQNMHNLKKEIDDVIEIMKNLLHSPPYSILFGRIKINNNESNTTINSS